MNSSRAARASWSVATISIFSSDRVRAICAVKRLSLSTVSGWPLTVNVFTPRGAATRPRTSSRSADAWTVTALRLAPRAGASTGSSRWITGGGPSRGRAVLGLPGDASPWAGAAAGRLVGGSTSKATSLRPAARRYHCTACFGSFATPRPCSKRLPRLTAARLRRLRVVRRDTQTLLVDLPHVGLGGGITLGGKRQPHLESAGIIGAVDLDVFTAADLTVSRRGLEGATSRQELRLTAEAPDLAGQQAIHYEELVGLRRGH